MSHYLYKVKVFETAAEKAAFLAGAQAMGMALQDKMPIDEKKIFDHGTNIMASLAIAQGLRDDEYANALLSCFVPNECADVN